MKAREKRGTVKNGLYKDVTTLDLDIDKTYIPDSVIKLLKEYDIELLYYDVSRFVVKNCSITDEILKSIDGVNNVKRTHYDAIFIEGIKRYMLYDGININTHGYQDKHIYELFDNYNAEIVEREVPCICGRKNKITAKKELDNNV